MTSNLPCLKPDFNQFVANSLLQTHLDAVVEFSKCETTFVEILLDVLQLGVVVVFVLDFLVKRTREFASSAFDRVVGSESSLGCKNVETCLASKHLHGEAC